MSLRINAAPRLERSIICLLTYKGYQRAYFFTRSSVMRPDQSSP